MLDVRDEDAALARCIAEERVEDDAARVDCTTLQHILPRGCISVTFTEVGF